MKNKIGFLFGFLIPALALAAVQTPDRSDMGIYQNYATNGGAERGKVGWTVSGTSAAIANLVVDTTNKYEGNAGFTWTPANADNFLTNAAVTLVANQGLSGQNCAALVYTKTSGALHALEAYNGSTVIGGPKLIPASTTYQKLTLNFPCPASGTVQIRINAGDTTPISFDELRWGDALGVNVGWVSPGGELYGTVTLTPNTDWTVTGTGSVHYGAAASWSYSGATGKLSVPSTKTPSFDVTFAPGEYFIEALFVGSQGGSAGQCYWQLNDGAAFIGQDKFTIAASTYLAAPGLSATYSVTTATTKNIRISLRDQTVASNCSIRAGATNAPSVFFRVWRYPTSSEQAYKPDQVAQSWSGWHATTCDWATTASHNTLQANDDATANCTLNTRNAKNMVVTAYGQKSGIQFTPSAIKTYFVCATPNVYSTANGTYIFAQLQDGSGNVIGTANRRETSGTNSAAATIPLCGTFTPTSTAQQTIVIKIASDNASNAAGIISAGSAVAPIEWSIVAISDSLPAPLLTGSVTSNSSGLERVERVKFGSSSTASCTSSPCAYVAQSGSWVTNVTRAGSGDYSVNFPAGTFSDIPTCACSTSSQGANFVPCSVANNSSTTRVRVLTGAATASVDEFVSMICMGPR